MSTNYYVGDVFPWTYPNISLPTPNYTHAVEYGENLFSSTWREVGYGAVCKNSKTGEIMVFDGKKWILKDDV